MILRKEMEAGKDKKINFDLIKFLSSITESIRETFSSIGNKCSAAVEQCKAVLAKLTQANQEEAASPQEDVPSVRVAEAVTTSPKPDEQVSGYGNDVLRKEDKEPAKTETLSTWEAFKQGKIPFRVYVL